MQRTIGVLAPFLSERHKIKLLDAASRNGFTLHLFSSADDALKNCAACEVLFGSISPEIVSQAKALKWLQLSSAGVDRYLDRALYANSGCILTNSSGTYGLTISEHLIMTLLMLMRRMPEYGANQQNKIWHTVGSIQSICGSTLTVVGTGDIGTNFAIRAKALGAECVRGVRARKATAPHFDETYCIADINQAVQGAQAVILCVPGTDSTKNIVNEDLIEHMDDGAFVLNVGRGSSVNQDALLSALQSGKLGGAALDVTVPEPLPSDHPLWTAKNMILTPHVSGNMLLERTKDINLTFFCEQLDRYAAGKPLKNIVDLDRGY